MLSFRHLASLIANLFKVAKKGHPAKRNRRKLGCESLEQRQMLAVTAVYDMDVYAPDGDLVSQAGDQRLVIQGDASNDEIVVSGEYDPTIEDRYTLEIYDHGTLVVIQNAPDSILDISAMTILGNDGNDTIDIENMQRWGSTISHDRTYFVDGGNGDDTIIGSRLRTAHLIGGAGNDTILGRRYADIIIGGSGDDVIQHDDYYEASIQGDGYAADSAVMLHNSPVELGEIGGIAVGGPDTLWMVEKGRNQPARFIKASASGEVERIYTLEAIGGDSDFQSIEVTVENGRSVIYLADIGDPNAVRQNVTIYRIDEPQIGTVVRSAHIRHVKLEYREGPRHAESMTISSGSTVGIYDENGRGAYKSIRSSDWDTLGHPTEPILMGNFYGGLQYGPKELRRVSDVSSGRFYVPENNILFERTMYRGHDFIRIDERFLELNEWRTRTRRVIDFKGGSSSAISFDENNDRFYVVSTQGDGSTKIERYSLGEGNDTITSPQQLGDIWGDGGDDVIKRTAQFEFGEVPIYGGDGNDIIHGGDRPSFIFGEGGDDLIYGGSSIDGIDGGLGNDQIFGLGGDDHLTGGLGDDLVDGGDGDDVVEGKSGDDHVKGGNGNDRLMGDGYSGSHPRGGNDIVEGGPGDDILGLSVHWKFTLDFDRDGQITFADRAVVERNLGMLNAEHADGDTNGDGDVDQHDLDRFRFNIGTNGHRDDFDDIMRGGPGNDLIYGGYGDDQLDGGEGDDRINGGRGDDLVIGGLGNDVLTGDFGDDDIRGGDGDDRIGIKGYYNPFAVGDLNYDGRVDVADRNILSSNYGKSNKMPWEGDLTGDGIVSYTDFRVMIENFGFVATAAWNYHDPTAIERDEDNDTIDGGAGRDFIAGGGGNDLVTGGDGDDMIHGNEGADRLVGAAGDDVVQGGDGDDLLGRTVLENQGDLNNDGYINGNDVGILSALYYSNDRPAGRGDFNGDGEFSWADISIFIANYGDGHGVDAGNDTFLGGAGMDVVYAGEGDDVVAGGDDDDELYGELGDDRMVGNAGNDLVDGGDGDDLLGRTVLMTDGDLNEDGIVDAADLSRFKWGATHLVDGDLNGDRTVNYLDVWVWHGNYLSGHGVDDGDDTYEGHEGDDLVHGGDGNDTIFVGAGNDRVYGEGGNDWMEGAAGNDYLHGGAGDDYGDGGDGSDIVYGFVGNDTLFGGAGNDTVTGHMGDDELHGGDGDDLFYAGSGNDQVWGDAGNDRIYGRGGDDEIHGGDGDDIMYGERGNDVIRGGDGNNEYHGGDGDDIFFGGIGDEIMYGDAGNDRMFASYGDDVLFGGDGNDVMRGWEGDDVLIGGDGDDSIRGSRGNDIMVGGAGDDRMEEGEAGIGIGYDGRDLIIGGLGADIIAGHRDDDILIGGRTIYDDNIDALRAIFQVWLQDTSFESRVAQIREGTGPTLVGIQLKANVTVFDDQVTDEINTRINTTASPMKWVFADQDGVDGDDDVVYFHDTIGLIDLV